MSNIRIILDTDPGIDDAVAIVAAYLAPEISIELISTVSGNVNINNVTNNALKLVELMKENTPVAKGSDKPLVKAPIFAESVHGESGLGNLVLPEPKLKALDKNYVEAMRDTILSSDDKITLVAIGPLTNLAHLLSTYPKVKKNIDRLVFMGGSASRGNMTPNAEFNIFVDPHAAKQVLESGIDIVMIGLDATHIATLDPITIDKIAAANAHGSILKSMCDFYSIDSDTVELRMHDLCTIVYLIKPEIFEEVNCFVTVETQGEFTTGATVVDLDHRLNQKPNAQVCMNVDVDKFRQTVLDIFSQNI